MAPHAIAQISQVASRRIAGLLALCALAAAADGFDTQIIGFTGPLLARDLHFAPSALGWLFSIGGLGGAIGGFLFGSLADRFGRVRVLILCAGATAVLTGVTILATDLTSLLLLRFLTGLGLGGAMPCFLGLGVQAMPEHLRRPGTAILYAMFPAGGIVGGLASAQIVVDYGWQGVFLGGALFLGVLVLPLLFMSEPPISRTARDSGPLRHLFAERRSHVTLWMWALFMCTTPSIVLLSMWMPALLQMLGVTAARASLLVGLLNLGSLVMSLAIGWLIQRFSAIRVMVPVLIGSAIMWVAIGALHAQFALLTLAVVLAGSLIGGAVTGVVAIVSTIYPDDVRATALGSGLGFGRIGQMVLPPLVGSFLVWSGSPVVTLAACAVPCLLALVPLLAIVRGETARTRG